MFSTRETVLRRTIWHANTAVVPGCQLLSGLNGSTATAVVTGCQLHSGMNGSTATSTVLRDERIYGYVSCIPGWMDLRLQGTYTLHINTLYINTGTHCTTTHVHTAHQHRYTLHINTGDSGSRHASVVNLIISP